MKRKSAARPTLAAQPAAVAGDAPRPVPGGDWPVTTLAADELGRAPFARALAEEILSAPVDGAYVMGLNGVWGSGKTSVLNMTADAIGDRAVVVHVNPWMFAGSGALDGTFFEEISRQLPTEPPAWRRVAAGLGAYGRMLLPATTPADGEKAASAAPAAPAAVEPSPAAARAAVRAQLAGVDRRLVVLVDDVDRLSAAEISGVVRLVRLLGDFPNTVYMLAFDRHRVEECLGGGDLARGRDFLEKIVEVLYEVPALGEPDLATLVVHGLRAMTDVIPAAVLESGDWSNIFTFVVQPQLSTPRQARRYLRALPLTLHLVGEEVALADVLGLEAVRVLRPEMFGAIVSVAAELGPASAGASPGFQPYEEPGSGPLGPMIAVDPELAEAICRWLFPGARRHFESAHTDQRTLSQWRAERRVAHPAVLRFFLERRLPEGVVPARTVESMLAGLSDAKALRAAVRGLTPAELADGLRRLTDRVRDVTFQPGRALDQDPAVIALPVLLDLLPRLSARAGPQDEGGEQLLAPLIQGLLARVPQAEQRAAVVRSVLPKTEVLSGRLTLLRVAGHRPHVGVKLIGFAEASALEEDLGVALTAARPSDLAGEPLPLALAALMAATATAKRSLNAAAADDRFMLALIADAGTRHHGWLLGVSAADSSELFAWDWMAELLGEGVLVRRVVELVAAAESGAISPPADQLNALEMALRYSQGWRPPGGEPAHRGADRPARTERH
ncbi:MAG: P-loop NTPase fold protein [Candidatus Dormibacteria bacterium]|jgi:hypothetical protein